MKNLISNLSACIKKAFCGLTFSTIMVASSVMPQSVAAQDNKMVGVLAASAGLTERSSDGINFSLIIPGDKIFLDDEIRTSEDGRIQILLMDETTFSMGSSSTIVVDTFLYDPSDQSGSISANIKKGVFRFISGRIAKKAPENMKVTAGNAVISIRGTDVIGTVENGISTIVLLSGLIDMTSTSVGCGGGTSSSAGCQSSLVRPGFGVEMNNQGMFSSPTRFEPDEIDTVIESLDTKPDQNNEQSEEKVEEDTQSEQSNASSQQENQEEQPDQRVTENEEETKPDQIQALEDADKATQDQATSETPLAEAVTIIEAAAEEETAETIGSFSTAPSIILAPSEDEIPVFETDESGENLSFSQNKTEEEKKPSAFDLIVMRSFGLLDPLEDSSTPEIIQQVDEAGETLIDDVREEENHLKQKQANRLRRLKKSKKMCQKQLINLKMIKEKKKHRKTQTKLNVGLMGAALMVRHSLHQQITRLSWPL